MRKRYLFLGIFGFSCTLILGAFFLRKKIFPDAPLPSLSRTQEKVPDFSLKNLNEELITQAEFLGKPFILTVESSWCPFCKKQISDIAVIRKEFGDRVAWAVIMRKDTADAITRFANEAGITDTRNFLLDPEDLVFASIRGFSMPETLFADADGNVRAHTRGAIGREEIRRRIEELLR